MLGLRDTFYQVCSQTAAGPYLLPRNTTPTLMEANCFDNFLCDLSYHDISFHCIAITFDYWFLWFYCRLNWTVLKTFTNHKIQLYLNLSSLSLTMTFWPDQCQCLLISDVIFYFYSSLIVMFLASRGWLAGLTRVTLSWPLIGQSSEILAADWSDVSSVMLARPEGCWV